VAKLTRRTALKSLAALPLVAAGAQAAEFTSMTKLVYGNPKAFNLMIAKYVESVDLYHPQRWPGLHIWSTMPNA
jgi:hypothetical protein